jgi:hypothetical protein
VSGRVGFTCRQCGQWHDEWGVWGSLSDANFTRTCDLWDTQGREATPAMFGWLSTELSVYAPSTLNLKAIVHTQPVGSRPLIELEPLHAS